MPNADLTPELARSLARVAGLDLSLERASDLIPALEMVLGGDARIAALDLGTLSAVGTLWPQDSGPEVRLD